MATRIQRFERIPQPLRISRDNRLRGLWMGIVGGFKCRPQPRNVWDAAGRDTCPTSPWDSVQLPVRAALRAAVAIGDARLIERTKKEVESFYAGLLVDALAVLPENSSAGMLALSTRLTLESSESSVALQNVIAQGDQASGPLLENAIKETAEVENAAEKCIGWLSARLHKGQRPFLSVHR